MDYEKLLNETDSSSEGDIDHVPQPFRRGRRWTKIIIAGLGLLVIIQTIALISLASNSFLQDPLLVLWCEYSELVQQKAAVLTQVAPANQVIKYKNIRHDAEDRSPYVAAERPLIDDLWMDLYDCEYRFLMSQTGSSKC